eukprot:64131_1
MQSMWKNPVISNLSKRIKYHSNPNIISLSSSSHRHIIYISLSSFSSSIKEQKMNGIKPIDLNNKLPGRPDFMEDEFENRQELEVLGLHETEISKTKAPDSRIFNPEYDPHYDPSEEDQVEVGKKTKSKQQHRIIKSNIKEDVVIEAEQISNMERLYSWIVLGMSVYCGMLAVRFYFMRDKLKQQKEQDKLTTENNSENLAPQTA